MITRCRSWRTASLFALTVAAASFAPSSSWAQQPAQTVAPDLSAICNAEAAQAAAPAGVTIKPIRNGAFKGATNFIPSKGAMPAVCQLSGSFVTNPATGKTANFLATFPAMWNGKYMQLGCSGHCGQFYVSNPATPAITVTAQGHAGQIIEKGYATFATDEGHEGMDSASWALKADGSIDQDFVDDFLYRADKALARMGKEFSTAFYAKLNGAPQNISRSYFNGCSGGGRDAMVVASYFPKEFDGIIAGSPYDPLGMTFQFSAIGAASARPGGNLTPALLTLFDTTVKKQCDALDHVKDGVIQNPAACNFNAERDLPHCVGDTAGDQCFTSAQIETASVITSAITDEKGNVVQPGYSVSELGVDGRLMAMLSDPNLKIFVNRNDPAFKPAAIFSFKRGGPGPVSGFHAVVAAAEVAKAKAALHGGAGHLAENTATLMSSGTKLLMWHNYSDEKLTPFSSVNWYKRLAAKHGGYAKVRQQVRLFMLPGTTHCSITGIAPNSFDAIGAIENWVEKGQAPDAMQLTVANRQFSPGAAKAANLGAPRATMPMCKFPEMARYNGKGDMKDGANWSCPANDTRMLAVGESGAQAGVVK